MTDKREEDIQEEGSCYIEEDRDWEPDNSGSNWAETCIEDQLSSLDHEQGR